MRPARLAVPVAPTCAARHRGFVGQLGRGRRLAAAPPRTSFVLRRLAQIVLQRSSQSIHHALSVIARGTLAATSAPGRERASAILSPSTRDTIVVLRERIETRRDRTVRILRETHTRAAPAIERVQTLRRFAHVQQTQHARSSRAESERAPLAAPMRVLVRPAPGAAVAAADSRRDASAEETLTRRRDNAPAWRLPMAEAPALPPHELSRVTEHVMERLDQRARSFRERSGRI